MSSTAENDAEDVNDFLKRIQELGTKRDQEDEERNRKLEEEILQGRKERQARRAERARSISPTKDSPAGTPPSYKVSPAERMVESSRATLSPPPELQPPSDVLSRDKIIGAAMERLTGEDIPAEQSAMYHTGSDRQNTETSLHRNPSIKASPSSAMPPSRNSPLSWQRRPTSQASDRPRSRPLSMIATENAARSPRATPEPSSANDEQNLSSRDQISQMLGSKDPAWFKQTADRGENSPAYRRNQVEDNNEVEVTSSSRVQLPGMSREPVKALEKPDASLGDTERSVSPSRNSSYTSNLGRGLFAAAAPISGGFGSAVPLTSAHRLDPPTNSQSDDEITASGRGLAMSPSQGRISPERVDRAASPTKGMGGFVQSAMMKRSDSVNKRWSVQSPPGLSRGNSVASNRSSVDPTSTLGAGIGTSRDPRPSSLSRDNSPLPQSRPTSSHSNATFTQENDRPGTSSSMRSTITTSTINDGFVKPLVPAHRSQVSLSKKETENNAAKDTQIEVTPPSSPSKLSENRRWSPTKASWLESALNKPESPKPKVAPPPVKQPAWMSELSKTKQRTDTDSARNVPGHKHEVNIGGLLRSPPPGGLTKPPIVRGLPANFSSGGITKISTSNSNSQAAAPKLKSSEPSEKALDEDAIDKPESLKSDSQLTSAASVPKPNNTSASSGKVKPETPPKKDFRANLKPRQLPSESAGTEESEFKNVFGQLRRTKTQNYVAPDELKDNILRGKAGLSVTGGPKKTERKDEFKEAILKKKEGFKKAQLEGSGVTRPDSGGSPKAPAPLPEALAKKAVLGRAVTVAAGEQESLNTIRARSPEIASSQRVSKDVPIPNLQKETSAPGRMQGKGAMGGKLADRFNPALAGILARGPPATSDGSRNSNPALSQRDVGSSTVTSDINGSDSGQQLTHMTKARARGPRRKAPKNVAASPQVSDTAVSSKKYDIKSPFNISAQLEMPFEDKIRKAAIAAPPKEEDSEPEDTKVSSPRKLDMNRRSKFLEEVPNKNENTLQHLDPPKPLSPTMKHSVDELPVSKLTSEPPLSGRKITPTSKPKPSSLATSTVVAEQSGSATKPNPTSPATVPKSAPKSPETKPKPAPKSPEIAKSTPPTVVTDSKTTPQSTAATDIKSKPQQVNNAVDTDSVISVKNSSSIFNRQNPGEKFGSSSADVKAPIKLPTHEDEKAAMRGAGLRSQEDSPVEKRTITGLGLQGPKTQTIADQRTPTKAPLTPFNKANVATIVMGSSSKPLAVPVSQKPMSPSHSSTPKPISPKKITGQAVPQSSEASKILVDFFGKNDFNQSFAIDTAAVLAARSQDAAKIKTLRSQLFQLSGDGKKQLVPSHQERILFENNMYVCSHTFGTPAGKKVIEAYFWAGDGVSESSIEDAELFALKEAKAAGGQLIKIRQGKETSEFIEALGGIMITRRGSSNKYDSLAPHILCGRRFAGQIVFDEVDFAPSSLCSGFPYLISTQSGKSYLWKGKGSGIDELSCARLIGMDFGVTGEIEEIEDGNEPVSFLNIFGPDAKILKSADHWRLKPNYQNYSSRLFCANAASQSQITELAPFNQSSLSPSQIYVLDAFFEIYIIIGSESQSQYSAFCTALLFAQEYGILAASMEDRPFVPVSTVILEGTPRDLKFVFRKWKDGASPTFVRSPATLLSRGRSLRVVPLSAALDATRF